MEFLAYAILLAMDELEISGRRYISTARAAKENKYHSDYIGQLVRSGKVLGQKVGRSWYVEVGSLNQYLGGEASKSAAPLELVVESEKPVIVEPVIEHPVRTKKLIEKESAEDGEELFQKFARKPHVIKAIGEQAARPISKPVLKEEPKVEVEETSVALDKIAIEAPAEDITAPEMDEEIFIPVKLESSVPHIKAPEDSFYKIPTSGLKYIASRSTKKKTDTMREIVATSFTTMPSVNAIVAHEEKRARYSMRVGVLASLIMIVGIVSLGGGILLSYYLHSATTVSASGQASGLIFSQ